MPSGVRASLRSVCFINPYFGWIAGREELPDGGSTGVLLCTQDGGVTWKRVLVNALPGLNAVRFADDKTGYLAGDGSEHYPSGLFVTTDGGHSWLPVPGPRIAVVAGRPTAPATPARWPAPGTASGRSATARPTPSIWTPSAVAICAASGCTARRASPSARAGWC